MIDHLGIDGPEFIIVPARCGEKLIFAIQNPAMTVAVVAGRSILNAGRFMIGAIGPDIFGYPRLP